MASEQELADMERMSSDYVPEITVLKVSYLHIESSLTSSLGTVRWKATINPSTHS